MLSLWQIAKQNWLRKTKLPDDIHSWAIDLIEQNEPSIDKFEDLFQNNDAQKINADQLEKKIKEIRKDIKKAVLEKENTLDDISLNTPNSYKLQVSIPSNLSYLMKVWAAAEGRDLSSVALQCLEIGLREMKSKGSIPLAAIKRYNINCEKRIALAEVNNLWESHEETLINNLDK